MGKGLGALLILAVPVLAVILLQRRRGEEQRTPSSEADAGGELAFFNSLSGTLLVELTEALVPISPELANTKAPATAKIKTVDFQLKFYDGADFRPLTDDEWSRVVLRAPRVVLHGIGGGAVPHAAPNGSHFTVRDLAAAIAETERRTRGESEWFDGIDVHHVFFEGLVENDDGSWTISWGS